MKPVVMTPKLIEKQMAEAREFASFANFLAEAPPGLVGVVPDLTKGRQHTSEPNQVAYIQCPTVSVYCPACEGMRNYWCTDPKDGMTRFARVLLEYTCQNCMTETKLFAVRVEAFLQRPAGAVVKFGEFPPYGERLPGRVLTLMRPHHDELLKGYRCEKQSLGIAAFAYYRRIVEARWTGLVDAIIDVARQAGSDSAVLDALNTARDERQFGKALKSISDAIPDAIRIQGQNPLALLHNSLSDGLHNRSDEECLELAGAVRKVLVALAERIDLATKDQDELHEAIRKLNQPPG